MASELQIEVYKQHRTAQEKYTYFLLAAVGAAIAFALNQTQGAKLVWSQTPLGCAVVFWGFSFYFGCRYLDYVKFTLFANADLLLVQSGQHPLAGRNGELVELASEVIREQIENNSKRANRFACWQFNFLIVGAISYIGWHILGMWLRSFPAP